MARFRLNWLARSYLSFPTERISAKQRLLCVDGRARASGGAHERERKVAV